jgi:VIT1/CCC1 family predicted Fe2+/Mn2+ transporter
VGGRARRKAEAIRAKERYEAYIRQRAQEEIERQEAEKVAAVKAKEAEERRRVAEEEFKRRQV